jgi:glycosyltransferase involved in cell wall biosynthesis
MERRHVEADAHGRQGTLSPVRVGFLIDRWQPDRGGAERALADLARGLAERGHEPRVFALEGVSEPWPLETVRFPLALSRGRRERALGEALVAAAERAGCDVMVGIRHLPRVDLYWPHAGSHAAALRGVRSARASRLLAPEELRMTGRHRSFLDLERGLLEGGGARRIACVSGLVREELSAAYPGAVERLVLVPDAVDLERFHPRERDGRGAALRRELGIAAGTPLLGFSARRPELKGLPTLFEALAGLAERPWHLLVAGPKDAQAWRERARVARLPPERVRVVSEIAPEAFAPACDLLAHPTWRDACGLVVLEALAAGTPVVTTRQAGAAEAVKSIDQGEVLDRPGDVASLRAALRRGLDRIAAGASDREAVRSGVVGHERGTWISALEAILLDLAERRPV